MKILLVVGEDLFHYQRQMIAELIPLKNVKVYLLSCSAKSSILKDSKLFGIINSKFPVIKTDPYSFENAQHYIENSTETAAYNQDLHYDYVLNFCETGVIEDFKIKYSHVLKAALEIRTWYAACINRSPYTTIQLLSSVDNKNFVPFKFLPFTTETGIYNNRNKALYYFSYLVKSVFNHNKYEVREPIQQDYNFLQNCSYHFMLLLIILRRKFTKTQFNWKVAILRNNVPKIITQEAGSFWADPFIVKELNNNWIFFEELDHKTGIGKISVLDFQENQTGEKKVVLEKPYHLSFPNVFKHGKDYFMMPEESAAAEQNIYKSTSFPCGWEKCKTILTGIKVVDPVFIFCDGRYWLFFNRIEDFEYENNERLYLYSSDDLFSGEWISHPQNPIVIDKSKARNAGKITEEDHGYIRVSQNCRDTYGANICKNRITHLSDIIYREEKIEFNMSFHNFYGCHTLNTDDGISVIDILIKERK